MDLIKSTTAVANRPAPITSGVAGWAARSSATGGTVITADVINSILAELKNLIEGANLSLNVSDDTLVKQAVEILATPPGYTYDPNSGGTFDVTTANLVGNDADFNFLQVEDIHVSGTSTSQPHVIIGKTDNSGIEKSPFIDFKSKNQSATSDVRIIASGGNVGTDFQGNLEIMADMVTKWTDGVSYKFDSFPSGTKIVFYQPSAPIGWTKVTLSNNYILATGTGGTSAGGGGAGHNIFTGCNVVANHTHSVDPANFNGTTSSDSHAHTYSDIYYMEERNTTDSIFGGQNRIGSNATDTDNESYARTGTTSSDAHTHTFSVNIPSTTTSANNNNNVWQPLYYTVIVAQKD